MTPKARSRRNARARLLRYLLRGGRLVADESSHYCRANRSGEAYDGKMVERLIHRGHAAGGQQFVMINDPNARVWYLAATD